MDAGEAVRKALPLFADVEDAVAVFQRNGIPAEFATRIYQFMPIAFGRVFLDGLGIKLSGEYIQVDVNGAQVTRRLADEPVYTASLDLASDVKGSKLFGPIALRSTEVKAINRLLNAGSNPPDLLVGPPIIG